MALHHLAFRTHDLEALARFYGEVFGWEVYRRQGERAVWFRLGAGMLMLELAEPGENDPPAGSKELFCVEMPENERQSFRRKLAGLQVDVEDETEFTLYFRDPDGRRVGVSSYRFEP